MPGDNEMNGVKRNHAISAISVSGFKSISEEQSIEVRPLTLLAGANSSGKSSMMQAVLLLKQTLEATYDPGPLLLDGPNVRFTSTDQMLFHSDSAESKEMAIKIGLGNIEFGNESAEVVFGRDAGKRLTIQRCKYGGPHMPATVLRPEMSHDEIIALWPYKLPLTQLALDGGGLNPQVVRERCFLRPIIYFHTGHIEQTTFTLGVAEQHSIALQNIIHVPGLRGNPERAYPKSAHGPDFAGTFENYTASVIAKWSQDGDSRMKELSHDLNTLGLTWKVEAIQLNDTRVELRVGRLRKPRQDGANELVNIADVGFGVSQTLPVLVALLAAQPGQLVYLEQPEIHLHPSAQLAMASLLAKAARRGVRVVAETHSALLLLGVQSQVADKSIVSDQVKLHWFSRDDNDGATTITSADLDSAGRFGDWPEDFDHVSLHAQAHYLDTAEALLATE